VITEKSDGPKILFVAMQHSIHVARWIELAASSGAQLHLFPLDPTEPNPSLRGVSIHWPVARAGSEHTQGARLGQSVTRRWFNSIDPTDFLRKIGWRGRGEGALTPKVSNSCTNLSESLRECSFAISPSELGPSNSISNGQIRLGESTNESAALFGPWVLAALIRRLRPALIHSMEFQHAGYLVLKTKEIYGENFPAWLATNWGSDIFFFRRFPDHAAQIRRLLEAVDFYSCECTRDVGLAQQLGYAGPVLPILPNSGGFDIDHVRRLRSPQPPSRRKVIMIKGYHHFAGRAMTSIRVLERLASRLQDFEIILYSVSAEPRAAALNLAARNVLNIRVIDWATHDEILTHFGRARLYMGISISDAISTSVLESMAMGAFPIQTDTSCCDEWFEDGKGGFVVSPDDLDGICARFERALDEDALVDRAAEINWEVVCNRLDARLLRPKMKDFYSGILGTGIGLRTSSPRNAVNTDVK
jgi:hypothetical protein